MPAILNMARCFSEFYYHLIKNIFYIIDCTTPFHCCNILHDLLADRTRRRRKISCRGLLSIIAVLGDSPLREMRRRWTRKKNKTWSVVPRDENQIRERRAAREERGTGERKRDIQGREREHMVKTRKVSASINSDDRDERATAPRSISLSIALGSVAR